MNFADYSDVQGNTMPDPATPPPNGMCLFFRLPGEIRNEIYDLTLYHPDGIFCRNDYAKVVVNGEVTWRVRVQIFPSQEAATSEEGKEANQLKYVCRQFRAETTGVVIKANAVMTFIYTKHCRKDNCSQLEDFLGICPTEQKKYLRKIELIDAPEIKEELTLAIQKVAQEVRPRLVDRCRFPILNDFCKDFPKATIFLPLYYSRGRPSSYVRKFMCFAVFRCQIREVDYSNLLPGSDVWRRIQDIIDQDRMQMIEGQELPCRPAAVRFRMPESEWAEKEFRTQWKDAARLHDIHDDNVDEWLDKLVEEFKGWVENGL